MRRHVSALVLLASAALGGCHSHYIAATITNASTAPLHVLQVDYPSASFGTQDLAPGAIFRYRFKLLGSGPIKISFTDDKRGDHAIAGPHLNEGQEGTLAITVTQTDAQFHPELRP